MWKMLFQLLNIIGSTWALGAEGRVMTVFWASKLTSCYFLWIKSQMRLDALLGMGCGCAPHMANHVIYWMFYDTFCIQRICNSISAPINTHCFGFLQNTNTNPQIHKYKYKNTNTNRNTKGIRNSTHTAMSSCKTVCTIGFSERKATNKQKSLTLRFWRKKTINGRNVIYL